MLWDFSSSGTRVINCWFAGGQGGAIFPEGALGDRAHRVERET